jgi:hypothetical protein
VRGRVSLTFVTTTEGRWAARAARARALRFLRAHGEIGTSDSIDEAHRAGQLGSAATFAERSTPWHTACWMRCRVCK